MTPGEYLDLAKARHNLPSDRALADKLGKSASWIAWVRTKRTLPGDAAMMDLAELAGMPVDQALIDLAICKAATPRERDTWLVIRQRLVAAIILALLSIAPALPVKAAGIFAEQKNSAVGILYIMRLWWRRRLIGRGRVPISPSRFNHSVNHLTLAVPQGRIVRKTISWGGFSCFFTTPFAASFRSPHSTPSLNIWKSSRAISASPQRSKPTATPRRSRAAPRSSAPFAPRPSSRSSSPTARPTCSPSKPSRPLSSCRAFKSPRSGNATRKTGASPAASRAMPRSCNSSASAGRMPPSPASSSVSATNATRPR